jgi:hypothetical protein
MRCLRGCLVLTSLCCSLLAQKPDIGIEIEGVQIKPGITVSDALILLKDKDVSRDDNRLLIKVPQTIGQQVLHVIVGTLQINNEIVVGACKPWSYSDPDDSELARVLFGAVNGSSSGPKSQAATITTSVERKPQQTFEVLLIQIGQRVIRVVRSENHGVKGSVVLVDVEECLLRPGWSSR